MCTFRASRHTLDIFATNSHRTFPRSSPILDRFVHLLNTLKRYLLECRLRAATLREELDIVFNELENMPVTVTAGK
jgi:hypothetical protein